ncbi:MAG: MlaD family protein [Candidatus Omnitrophica bacterium]|jgi:phospholipid/cholesterol/gamma-HCH transport system substrate-binding protein|nr:MlaD family protein [Candidatus Omnitrophota bacterium]
MKSLEFNVKVGLFILIGLVILTVITFSISDFFFKPGYTIFVELGFANGIQPSAPVRLAGISVGEVKESGVFKDNEGKTMVRLKLWLTDDAKVEEDAQVIINTLGLIGEKYVEIIPGTPSSPLVQDCGVMRGHDSVSVEQITKKGYEIALKLEQAIDHMEGILAQVKSGHGTVGKLIYDETIYNEAETMVKDLKAHPWKLLGGGGRQRVKPTEDKKPVSGPVSNFSPS